MSTIHNAHDYKVQSIFGSKKIGKSNFNLFYGVEMEYEVVTPETILVKADLTKDPTLKYLHREKVAAPLQDSISDFAFMKHDGSGKNMFEVVTVPMALDKHKEHWDKFFIASKNVSITVENSCGMHVHASKDALTPFQIGKMLVFIYSKKNFPFIKSIAGRTPPQKYAEINPKKVGDAINHKLRKSALNLSSTETIEFRLFKSTLNKSLMLKNIEFCDALIRLTWPGICGFDVFKKQGVKLFCDYVKENKNIYPNLNTFLERIKYCGPKKRGRPRKYKSDLDNFMPKHEPLFYKDYCEIF